MKAGAVGRGIGHAVQRTLGRHPGLFFPCMRLRPKYRGLLVSDDTEVVIEGYPRSGNTFAVAAFELAQCRPVIAARHTHAPAQVIEATRRRLPTLVLLRQPRDAALSLVIREPRIPLRQALHRYLWFYEAVRPYRQGYVVAPFDEVVSDFGPPLSPPFQTARPPAEEAGEVRVARALGKAAVQAG